MRIAVGALLVVGCTTAPPAPVTPARARPTPRPALVLPGDCVNPTEDAVERLGPDASGEAARVEREVDLDADGTPDQMVTHTSFCGTGGCNWHVYVMRGACGHHVGELFGLLPIARATATNGLSELELTVRSGCAGMARTELRARFDGAQYSPYETRTCRCPEPGEEGASEIETDPERWCDEWHAAGAQPD